MLNNPTSSPMPPARLTGWLWSVTSDIPFDSVVCPFCGTGTAARLFKEQDHEVTASAVLTSYARQARALIENDDATLDQFEAESIIGPAHDIVQLLEGVVPAHGLSHSFGAWLDRCHANIERIDHDYKKALAFTAVSKVIFQLFSFDEESRVNTTEEDWNQVFRFYIASLNDMVFSNGKLCLAYEGDASRVVRESGADALCFYVPRERISLLTPAERCVELFNRFCHEKQLEEAFSEANGQDLGHQSSAHKDYLLRLSDFLENAADIRVWIVCSGNDSPVNPDELRDILSKMKKNIKMLQKEMVYSKSNIRREYIFVCEG